MAQNENYYAYFFEIMLTFPKLLPKKPPPCRISAFIAATDHLIPAVLYLSISTENSHVWLA
jgi:hypothetical protein